MNTSAIADVRGFRVWDSRGRPTVEAEVRLQGGSVGRAIAPAGASCGRGEAVDRRDGGSAFAGLGVQNAIAAIDGEIRAALLGHDVVDQARIDATLIAVDGTPAKSRLGGNATIAVSMAAAHAAAAAAGLPLWRWLAGDAAPALPLPEIQIIGGGVHAHRRLDIQDFMVVAVGAADYAQALEWTAEVYRAAGELLAESGRLAGLADEGGYWPSLDGNEAALAVIVRAIERAGLRPGEDVAIALDVAASVFGARGRYRLARDLRELDAAGMSALLRDWIGRYPIISVEDPLAEDDAAGLADFTGAVGPQIQVVGDDFLVTSAERIAAAAAVRACNAVLIKPNQAGTLSEAQAALQAARAAGFDAILSARSGESEDVTVVHLAVGWGVPQLKVGAFARSERMAKWNEGLRIAREIDGRGRLPARAAFRWR